ncbi:MAG TPA: hypothetical protein VF221_07555 [Chloroflexota bacterium]
MNQPAEAGTVAQSTDEPPIQGDQDRQREELRLLVIGFGTGLAIAGIFLIYIVLAIAKLL